MSSKYHLLILELPGHGESFSTDSKKYTIKNQATWLKQFIKRRNKKFVNWELMVVRFLEYSELYPFD